ncbi:threonine ammonia-lyase [Negadavirga shengliensis]|uniref:Threonine/serine dehydratase n=1 Tax=Negadavirga shengliensis TaxID=1389218 RepID=A0ABV9SXY2_9BACT
MNNPGLPRLDEIQQARARIDHMIHWTPLLTSTAVNKMARCQVYFKCENLQKTGAFKARGAANAVMKLGEEAKENGVATHSSGNHAAALARAAGEAGVPSFIVMPSTAPEVKKKAVRSYGGEIIECEPTLSAREATLEKIVDRTGATFIPPYDHWDVIEGQATCAWEIGQEGIVFDTIMAPVGGGGLLAGTALSTHYLSPRTKVIAGEPQGADDAYRSFKAKKIIPVQNPDTIADGLLTLLGKKNFEVIVQYVQDILTVNDEEIIAAMRIIFERMKLVVEPSAAVPLAALLKNKEKFEGEKVAIILSGGNVDVSHLPFG